MIDADLYVDALVAFALDRGLIKKEDVIYSRNRVLAALGKSSYRPSAAPAPECGIHEILGALLAWAAENGGLERDSAVYRDLLDTELMAAVTPRPSEVVAGFARLYERSPKEATDWYYDFSKATNYIRTDRISKDMVWTEATEYGEITVTINLSKPEKDPVAIAAALASGEKSDYPSCAICAENEGFLGTLSSAPRGNHRIIPMTLGGESWFLQYSPYSYYNEHCIALNAHHTPMKIDRDTFVKLIDFTELFPHYFIGSNADLPIVGGSILTHDHFQGGRFAFAMESAPAERHFSLGAFPGVGCAVVKWPMSVIRLSSEEKGALVSAAAHILEKWRAYSDENADIHSRTGGTPHNTVTPIARRRGAAFELDLVLRNNRATDEHPHGIFHPHAEKHHIKRENIGLIEVMGLAVLPPRLKSALEKIASCLTGDRESFFEDEELKPHADWYVQLCKSYDFTQRDVMDFLKKKTGDIFVSCLEDAGVFKRTPKGAAAFKKFTDTL